MKVIAILILLICIVKAETVYLTNGAKIENVITQEGKYYWTLTTTSGRSFKIESKYIYKVEVFKVDRTKKTKLYGELPKAKERSSSTFNKGAFPLTLFALLIGYDYLSDGGDLNDNAKKLKELLDPKRSDQQELRDEIHKIESQRNRKYFIAAAAVAISIFNIGVNLRSVDISAKHNSLSLTYKF